MANREFAKVRKELKGKISLRSLKSSDFYSAMIIGSDWLIIAFAITVACLTKHPVVYLLSIPLIGSRMMALGVLMHEASHGNLFKKSKLSRLITDLLLAWPIAQSVSGYKHVHKHHHQHLKTDKDTEKPLEAYHEFQFPLPKRRWYLTLLSDLLGISFIKYRFGQMLSRPATYKAKSISFSLTVALLLIVSGLWQGFLLFWVVPYCTWFQLLLRLHASSEHFAVPAQAGFQTRTLKINRMEAFFFFPHHMNYHCEHHLFPQVPFRHLPLLHKQLLNEQCFENNAHLTYGIKGLFTELTHA